MVDLQGLCPHIMMKREQAQCNIEKCNHTNNTRVVDLILEILEIMKITFKYKKEDNNMVCSRKNLCAFH